MRRGREIERKIIEIENIFSSTLIDKDISAYIPTLENHGQKLHNYIIEKTKVTNL